MLSLLQQEQLQRDLVRNLDFHGRRITNASDAVNPQDYVTKIQLDSLAASLDVIFAPDDTDLMGPVTSLSINRQSDNATIPGNGFEVAFNLPQSQFQTYEGYTILIHDSSTLPTATTFDTGTAGELVTGINRLTDLTKSFTPDALIGKDIVIFSTKRSGSPTYDYEAAIILARITDNDATSIEFEYLSHNYTLTGLKYYIVTAGGNNHWFEKLKYFTPLIPDRFSADRKRVRFDGGSATIYAWVLCKNYWGFGPAPSSATRTFEGVSTTEIKLLAVDNGRIASLAVTFDKISVSQLSAISANLGTITAGTVTAATIRTSSSNPRIELSTSTFRCYDGSGTVQVEVLTSSPYLRSEGITGYSGGITIQNAAGSALIALLSGGGIEMYGNSTNVMQLSSSGVAITTVDVSGTYKMDGNEVISSSRVYTGSGGVNTSGAVTGGAGTFTTGTFSSTVQGTAYTATVGSYTVPEGQGLVYSNNSVALVTGEVKFFASGSHVGSFDSGGLKVGSHSAIGSETITGYITIKDLGGTSRKIAVVS